MKNKKIIGSVLVLVILVSTFLIFNKSTPTNPLNFEKMVITRLHEILGYEVSIGSLSIDEKSQKLTINNLGLSLTKESNIFLNIGKLEGLLPDGYGSSDEIVINKLEATNITLPIMDLKNSDLSQEVIPSKAYRDFYDVDAIVEISKASSSKILQERFSDLKKLLASYKLSKRESSICKNKKSKSKCNAIKKGKLKIQKKVLALVEDKKFFNLKKIIKENGPAIQISKFNEENVLKFLLKGNQIEVADSIVSFMKNLYDAQFINLESSDEYPDLTIKEIFIREKLSESAEKEMVGSVKDLSSIRSKMKDKTLFRLQGDFDKYKMKGISFRMLLHRGKNNAVSINSHILDMKLNDYLLFNDPSGRLQIKNANGNVKVKSFIFGGIPKGSVTTELEKLSFLDSEMGKRFNKLKSLKLVTNYERKEEGSYTDTIIQSPEKLKISKIEEFEKTASKELEEVLNSDEEMLSTYDVFLKNFSVNFNLINEELLKVWPSYKATNIRLGNQP